MWTFFPSWTLNFPQTNMHTYIPGRLCYSPHNSWHLHKISSDSSIVMNQMWCEWITFNVSWLSLLNCGAPFFIYDFSKMISVLAIFMLISMVHWNQIHTHTCTHTWPNNFYKFHCTVRCVRVWIVQFVLFTQLIHLCNWLLPRC